MSMSDEECDAKRAAHVGTGCQGGFDEGWSAGVAYGRESLDALKEAQRACERLRVERDAALARARRVDELEVRLAELAALLAQRP